MSRVSKPGFIGRHGRRGTESSYACRHVDAIMRPCKPNPKMCWLLVLDGAVIGRGTSEDEMVNYNRRFRIGGRVVRE